MSCQAALYIILDTILAEYAGIEPASRDRQSRILPLYQYSIYLKSAYG